MAGVSQKKRSRNTIVSVTSLFLSTAAAFFILVLQTEMKAVTSFVNHQRRCHYRATIFIDKVFQQQSQTHKSRSIHSTGLSPETFKVKTLPTRLYSSTSVNGNDGSSGSTEINASEIVAKTAEEMIAETPLFKSAPHLLSGLDTYTIKAEDDHPISLYGINSKETGDNDEPKRRPILMLHGRTWSSVPVYHLLGGSNQENDDSNDNAGTIHHSRSLMESLYDAGLQPYAIDFRGFGGTPNDRTNKVVPNRCVMDVECALDFIIKKHGISRKLDHHLPALMGWSQGALVAQMLAQKSPQMISKLVLYGSIYDPLVRYPREPLFTNGTGSDAIDEVENTFNAAIEDFTVEGSIPPAAAIEFAEAALSSDPIKARWHFLCQFNNCDPARVHVPTLVVAGDQDPYAPLRVQSELFANLGRGADRTWSIIADADHAVHMLDGGKERFLNIVKSFVENGKKGEKME